MTTEILNIWTQPVQPALESVREFNRRTVAYLEQLTALQQSSLQAHSDRLLANLKAGVEVSDLEGFKAYAARQPEVAREALEQIQRDNQSLIALNSGFVQDTAQYGREQAEEVAERTQNAARKTVKKVA